MKILITTILVLIFALPMTSMAGSLEINTGNLNVKVKSNSRESRETKRERLERKRRENARREREERRRRKRERSRNAKQTNVGGINVITVDKKRNRRENRRTTETSVGGINVITVEKNRNNHNNHKHYGKKHQRRMKQAISYLQTAKSSNSKRNKLKFLRKARTQLQSANTNKGGNRVAALSSIRQAIKNIKKRKPNKGNRFIQKAIEQTRKGIRYANRH